MGQSILDSVVRDLLSIPPLMRRNIQRKVVRTAFSQIEDLLLPHFEIMWTLNEFGTLHIAEIGERLQIPKPQMTHLIDRLESLGIVARQADSRDRRTVNIMLTDKGRKILEEQDCLITGSMKMTLSCLNDKELRELSISLRRLRDILSKLQ
jgi:DNA-binding MarR family transcriptional regulator